MRGSRTAMKSGPRLQQLEKALAQKRRPNIAINQSINKSLKKKKWTKDTNRYLTKEDIWMGNKHMESYSTSYIIREMQIKTVRKHYTLIRMAKSRTLTTPNAQKDLA